MHATALLMISIMLYGRSQHFLFYPWPFGVSTFIRYIHKNFILSPLLEFKCPLQSSLKFNCHLEWIKRQDLCYINRWWLDSCCQWGSEWGTVEVVLPFVCPACPPFLCCHALLQHQVPLPTLQYEEPGKLVLFANPSVWYFLTEAENGLKWVRTCSLLCCERVCESCLEFHSSKFTNIFQQQSHLWLIFGLWENVLISVSVIDIISSRFLSVLISWCFGVFAHCSSYWILKCCYS